MFGQYGHSIHLHEYIFLISCKNNLLFYEFIRNININNEL